MRKYIVYFCCLFVLTMMFQVGKVYAVEPSISELQQSAKQGNAQAEKSTVPYLFELLEQSDFMKSWQKLFSGKKNVPSWLTEYAKTKNGPSSPGGKITLGGQNYVTGSVCMAHNCGNSYFDVLFTENGKNAWGLLVENDQMRYFNNPDKEKQKALRALTVCKNFEELQLKAKQGDIVQQYNLGVSYENGNKCVDKDYKKAIEWYQKAAEQGDIDAQYNLSIMYAEGKGTTQDYYKAAEWLKKAAEQGDLQAQFNLGIFYYHGDGVIRDRDRGCSLMRPAAEQGHRAAIEAYNKICAK